MGITYSPKLPDGCVWKADPGYRKFPPDTTFTGDPTTIGTSPTNHMIFTGNTGDQTIEIPQITMSAFTLCYFFYHPSATTNDMTFGNKNDNASRFYHRDSGAAYRIRVHNSASVSVGDLVIPNGQDKWNWIAYGMEDGARKAWTNDTLSINTTTSDSTGFVLNNFGSPYASGPNTYHWPGYLGPVHVFNRLLTGDEASYIFNLNKGRFGL